MSISLVKGQKIDLTKGSSGLSEILVGLGWDPVENNSGGILGTLFGSRSANIDCDASVIMLNSNDKLENKKDLVYYGNLRNENDSIIHQGDNLTGEGEGDDEQIMLDLKRIPERIKKLVFVVNIYDAIKRKQDFGMIKNAFIRVVDVKTNKELLKFNLSENYSGKTSLLVGEIYRDSSNEWKFNAVGIATNDTSLAEIVNRYR